MSDLIVPQDPKPIPPRQSSDRLARDLEDAGSPELAARARRDEFNDFFSEHQAPQAWLRAELLRVIDALERNARKATYQDRQAMTLEAKGLKRVYDRAYRGHYLAGKAEADLWATHEQQVLAARGALRDVR
jgi:hypothetical protein